MCARIYICSDLIKVRSSTGCRRGAPPPGRLGRSIDPVIKIATYKKPLIVLLPSRIKEGGEFHLPWHGMSEKRRATYRCWMDTRFAFPPVRVIRFSSDNDNTSIQTARCICAFDLSIRKAYFSHYTDNRGNSTEWRVIPSHASAVHSFESFRFLAFVMAAFLLFVYHEILSAVTSRRTPLAIVSVHQCLKYLLYSENGPREFGLDPAVTALCLDKRLFYGINVYVCDCVCARGQEDIIGDKELRDTSPVWLDILPNNSPSPIKRSHKITTRRFSRRIN